MKKVKRINHRRVPQARKQKHKADRKSRSRPHRFQVVSRRKRKKQKMNINMFYDLYKRSFREFIESLVNNDYIAADIIEKSWCRLEKKWQAIEMQSIHDGESLYSIIIEIGVEFVRDHLCTKRASLETDGVRMMMDIETVFGSDVQRVISRDVYDEIQRQIDLEPRPVPEVFQDYFNLGLTLDEVAVRVDLDKTSLLEQVRRIRKIISNIRRI